MKRAGYILLFTFSLSSFSQIKEEPIWWEMQRNGQYLEVASYLLFKVQSDSQEINTQTIYILLELMVI